ncbi:hypothetical protein R1sor_019254 [Riccia sorocarpa]|uniref:Uncharacterized protein n=1 Tax=Riccia sorocarpa TaxID=122646 RepID=A0ABD3IG85_9MARC
MGCSRHPQEGAVGICGSCVSERLNKEGRKFPGTGKSSKLPTSTAEEYFLWKEEYAPSSSSSVSKHGQLAKGGRIVDTIATLIKTDYAIPNNYERPKSSRTRHHQQRGSSSSRRREHSTRSYANPGEASTSRAIIISEAAAASSSSRLNKNKEISTSDYEDGNGNADVDFRNFAGSELSKGKRRIEDGNQSYSSVLTKSGEICEIVPVEDDEEEGGGGGGRALALVVDRGEEKPVQTIYSLIDAEPKSAKFSRSTSKGSPASSSYNSHFSRSGSRHPQQQQQNSWTVFWQPSSHKDDRPGQTSDASLVPAGGGRTAAAGVQRGRTSVLSVNHEDERNDDGEERWDRPSSASHHHAESSSSQTAGARHHYPDRRLTTRASGREEKSEEEEGVSSNGGRRRSRLPVYDDDEYQQQQNHPSLQRRDGNSELSNDSPRWRQQEQREGGGGVVPSYIYERNQTWGDELGLAKVPVASVRYAPPSPPNTKKNNTTSSNNTHPPHHGSNNSNASGKIFHNGSTGSSNDVNDLQQGVRNRWKIVKKKSEKLLLHRGGGKQQQPVAAGVDSHQHRSVWPEEDAGGGQSSSGKLTPCASNCFPKATGRFHHHSSNSVNVLRREDANLSHEKLRHRRLSIYSYGIISHPQLNPLDSHLSSYSSYPGGGSTAVGGGGRGGVGSNGSRAPSALPYRGSKPQSGARDPYQNSQNGGKTLVSDLWDGDELSVSPCDHYVEVSHGDDGGVDFIPVSEAWARACDRRERRNVEGGRSPPSWNDRTPSSQVYEGEEESHYSSDSAAGFRAKEELTPVYEHESDRGYENYPVDREPDDEYLHEENSKHEFQEDKGFESHRSMESPTYSETPPAEAGIKSRQAKGKNVISEIEELEGEDEYYDHETDEKDDDNHSQRGKQQQHIGGYTLVTAKSPLSEAGSQSELEILPARNSLRALLFLDGEEVIVIQKKRGGEVEEEEGHEERSNKPDDATYELESEEDEEDHEQQEEEQEEEEDEDEDGSWAVDSVEADSQNNDNGAAGPRVSPWKNITLSSSMRRKFLWPRSSPQPHVRKTSETSGNSGPLESEHHHQHQSSLSFSDSEYHLARPRSPTSTGDNASSNLVTSECPEGPLRGSLSDRTLQDEVTGGTSEKVYSLVEEVEEEASLKSSPQRSSVSQASSPQRAASLSRSSSKSPHRTLSRGSSRRSRSSSWSSCLTDPAWTTQSQVPSKKGEGKGSQEKGGRFSSIIRKLRRRSSPTSKSLNASPWLGFSKASPPHREETASVVVHAENV